MAAVEWYAQYRTVDNAVLCAGYFTDPDVLTSPDTAASAGMTGAIPADLRDEETGEPRYVYDEVENKLNPIP